MPVWPTCIPGAVLFRSRRISGSPVSKSRRLSTATLTAFNLHEEIASLVVAQKIGVEKTVWVMPIYPDEPLLFVEAAKLEGLDLSGTSES